MNLTSSLVKEIIDTTGLRNIESTYFAGRNNDYFVYVEVQTHLSRALLRVRVLKLDEDTRTGLDTKLASNFSRVNYSLLFEGNEIIVIIPSNTGWVRRIREITDQITEYLSSADIATDSTDEKTIIEQIPESLPHIIPEPPKPSVGMGILGSFLGAIPGVIAWFISSIASNDGFLVQTPEVHANVSSRVFLAVIISCGSYWGFLLLSGATRRRSAIFSAPITIIMIYFVNHFSYAFLFFTNLPNLTLTNAFLQTRDFLSSYRLTLYYWVALLFAYLISFGTYFLLYRLREKFWKQQH
ncbi:MAG: hypothetical protein GXY43_07160 [Clostridiaceae bacterium]|nr:hypothetical protein [Clostridiaceae bacterium]